MVEIQFQLDPHDFVYKEYIQLSVDDPHVTLSDWQSNVESLAYYDSSFKDTKKIFNKDFKITTQAHYKAGQELNDVVHMRVDYFTHNEGSFCEEIIPLSFNQKPSEELTQNRSVAYHEQEIKRSTNTSQKTPIQKLAQKATAWKQYISKLVETTHKPWMRILLVFILGLLVSLTPCIYPMIPITIGILQAQAGQSIFRNFCTAFFYTLGLSTTFALLGLLAAFAGQQVGSLLSNPWIIIIVVALLMYVAFSLFGMYELYIPKFLNKKNNVYSGSLISAFVFGLISGTVASPCVSPALILVLTIVSSLQNLLWGFMLLLAFGFGMSMPLLIIGTFSTSINILPTAGSWMIEVKHLIGFLLFGMCFYFLNFILPWHVLLWFIAASLFVAGVFYLIHAQRQTGRLRTINTIIGIILIASFVFFAVKGFQALYVG